MIRFNTKEEAYKFYSDNVGDVISEIMGRIMRGPNVNDITEEIALYKVSTLNVVKLFQAAIASQNPNAIDKASELLQTKLRGVAEMVKIQATLESMAKDKITPDQLQVLIDKIVDAIYLECEKARRRDIAESIEVHIREHMQITLAPRGADIRPDMDLKEMIESVPKLEGN